MQIELLHNSSECSNTFNETGFFSVLSPEQAEWDDYITLIPETGFLTTPMPEQVIEMIAVPETGT